MKLESLEELRVFVQVAEMGSLTAAGVALGMPVNTVSRRLASLEHRAGVRLLYRTTRKNSLSQAGEVMLRRAARILAEVDLAERELHGDSASLSGVLRMAVPSIATRLGVLQPLHDLMEANPELRIQLRICDQLLNPVAEGLELVLSAGGLPESSLLARKICDMRPRLAVATSYAQRRGVPETLEQLSQHPCLRFMSPTTEEHWVLTDGVGQERVVPIDGRFSSDNSRALHDALYTGMGVGILMPAELHEAVRQGTLTPVLPGWHLKTVSMYAIYPPSRQRSARVRAVVELLKRTWEEAVSAT